MLGRALPPDIHVGEGIAPPSQKVKGEAQLFHVADYSDYILSIVLLLVWAKGRARQGRIQNFGRGGGLTAYEY